MLRAFKHITFRGQTFYAEVSCLWWGTKVMILPCFIVRDSPASRLSRSSSLSFLFSFSWSGVISGRNKSFFPFGFLYVFNLCAFWRIFFRILAFENFAIIVRGESLTAPSIVTETRVASRFSDKASLEVTKLDNCASSVWVPVFYGRLWMHKFSLRLSLLRSSCRQLKISPRSEEVLFSECVCLFWTSCKTSLMLSLFISRIWFSRKLSLESKSELTFFKSLFSFVSFWFSSTMLFRVGLHSSHVQTISLCS